MAYQDDMAYRNEQLVTPEEVVRRRVLERRDRVRAIIAGKEEQIKEIRFDIVQYTRELDE